MSADSIATRVAAFEETNRILDATCAAYEEERNVVLRYLLSLNCPLPDAQEITQEAFLAYYAALRNGTRIETRRAWLFAVSSRKYLNWRKSSARRATFWIEDEAQAALAIPDTSAGPETRLLEHEKVMAVRQAIQGLSEQQKICVHLRSEGLRYQEIADVLGISAPAVAEFLKRAIVRIRKVVHGSVA